MTKLTGRVGLTLVVAWLCGCSSGGKEGGAGGTGGGPAGSGGAPAGSGGTIMLGGAGTPGAGGGIPTGPCPPPIVAACGYALCGNGTRDQCTSTTTSAPGIWACPAREVTESCDGTDLGGDSCAAHGFGAGTLSCKSNCAPDLAACNECPPAGNGLLRCGPADVLTIRPDYMALAARGEEVGLAVSDEDGDADYPPSRVRFVRLSAALEVISTTTLETEAGALAAAPLASGWVVATAVEEGVVVHTLDAQGQKVARTTIMENPHDPTSWDAGTILREERYPVFAARPDGGPLLVWQKPRGLRAAVISADGRSATAPVDLIEQDSEAFSAPVAAYFDGAFSVIFKAHRGDGVDLIRVGTDGHVISTQKILAGQTVAPESLVAGVSHLRLIYDTVLEVSTTPGDQIMVQEISATGAAIGSPLTLANLGDFQRRSAALAVGDDTMVLLTGLGWNRLAIARLGADGQIAGAIRPLVGGPTYRAAPIVRRGSDVIVGWTGELDAREWIGMARLEP